MMEEACLHVHRSKKSKKNKKLKKRSQSVVSILHKNNHYINGWKNETSTRKYCIEFIVKCVEAK